MSKSGLFIILSDREGFTLIEVLIALVILGIGFSILVEGYSVVLAKLEQNEDYTYLTGWAEGKITEIINGYELNTHDRFIYQGKEYSWVLKESIYSDNIYQLTIEVEWLGHNSTKYFKLSRLNFIRGR